MAKLELDEQIAHETDINGGLWYISYICSGGASAVLCISSQVSLITNRTVDKDKYMLLVWFWCVCCCCCSDCVRSDE